MNLGVFIYLFVYLFISLLFSNPQQTVQMLCLPPLKQGERIIWPLGGFQVRCFLLFPGNSKTFEITGDQRNGGGFLPPQLVWN